MVKVIITGPECSGKTTLAKGLAKHFGVDFIPEYARHYLEENGPEYSIEDFKKIIVEQAALFEKNKDKNLQIYDTGMEVLRIWSQVKYGEVISEIEHSGGLYRPDLYLLTHYDIPYQIDPLRENPNDRRELYDHYIAELQTYEVPFIELGGNSDDREKKAIMHIETLIKAKT